MFDVLFYFLAVKCFYVKFVNCKKRKLAIFPSPAGMSLTKLSLARKTLIIPGLEELG
jgi:hypothetical protein